MVGNRSLDFLEQIKNSSIPHGKEKASLKKEDKHNNAKSEELIAVIDTETNWDNEVMSVGVAIGDSKSFECLDVKYYIFERESIRGGMFSNVLYGKSGVEDIKCTRKVAMIDLKKYLEARNITKIYAYNAKFDYGHLPELADFAWHDIMRLAAYKQYNASIPQNMEFCKTGRLKRGYGVEEILRMLKKDNSYNEVHNAAADARDELLIMKLLGHSIDMYRFLFSSGKSRTVPDQNLSLR
ncbi:hypothetical protein [Butyrivibrio sp. NC3005]|uniref:hypothetical protein n=1 Tax=Butyrivibrio sp. NC3005 TaxID=1280685 RepID=UPI00042762BD|nr:hypothetical protein [Butyrivibrio sp. NC3005]